MTPDVLRQLAEEWIPFNKYVGIRALRVDRGDILFEVPYRDELIGDPVKRAIHGGVISMLADTAGGFAVWSALDDDRSRISTIDLRIDYLLPGKQEPLRAHATLVRAGKAVGVADVRLYHPSNEGSTIATGKGVYAIRHGKDVHISAKTGE
jgi:uncharacterized protein (TIGR00369 family)